MQRQCEALFRPRAFNLTKLFSTNTLAAAAPPSRSRSFVPQRTMAPSRSCPHKHQHRHHHHHHHHRKHRSYDDAINALNSLQTPNAVLEARRKAGVKPNASSIADMTEYLARLGYSPEDLTKLNIIHVAGTKGKGSTCAFVDSILSQYRDPQSRLRKTGLFISPHLISVRERIRINSKPISEELFAKYFFQVWDLLEQAATRLAFREDGFKPRPAYARYITLMSWHVFLQEGVDIAVYETGIGGEFDATNLVRSPVAAGITTLGIDHVYVLGDTIDKIAWHKGGIMKSGSPAFTVEQVPEAALVLKGRAVEKNVDLYTVGIGPSLDKVRVRPNEEFQKKNASLAIALANAALRKLGIISHKPSGSELPTKFVEGLENAVFRGRCEVKEEERVKWYIDGAHTTDSLAVSMGWFTSQTSKVAGARILIFNQQSRTEAVDFLENMYSAARSRGVLFHQVIFCTNVTYADKGYKRDLVDSQANPDDVQKLTMQRKFAEKWSALDPMARVDIAPTIEQALSMSRQAGEGLPDAQLAHVLITGSLHLVGGALGLLEKADAL